MPVGFTLQVLKDVSFLSSRGVDLYEVMTCLSLATGQG